MKRQVFLALIILAVFVVPARTEELYGVVSDLEITGADAGKLIKLKDALPSEARFLTVGDTGITDFRALTYDSTRQPGLVAATIWNEIYLIDPDTAAATRIVSGLLPDPTPPVGLAFWGW